ncbi:glycosyltransferase family 4 protein [Trichloromonas sp.]|uniref:glycosyltransferase family 4 protein n=1 Tax=Trichloromonas sp. TaxID=3069249 RepID=UPI003D816B43
MSTEQTSTEVLRPLLLGSYDVKGGAAVAMNRLHRGLLAHGVESRLLVQERWGDGPEVYALDERPGGFAGKLRHRVDHLPLWCYPKREQVLFSPAWRPERVSKAVDHLDPSIVHLHWVVDGFLRIETLPMLNRPLVWTLHDMWPFTGGCHYAGVCTRYRQTCGCCPMLGSGRENDLSRRTNQRKMMAWDGLQMIVVAPSRWLAECASSSAILGRFPIEVIPNGLDLAVFRPDDRGRAREMLGLPGEGRLVLFGAADPTGERRKGYDLLCDALRIMGEGRESCDYQVVVFGSSEDQPEEIEGCPVHWLGQLVDDESLRLAYAAADLFVAPSREENLSNTVMEALACGTPCVAFRVGGMPDLIDHEVNGYLADPGTAEDLARGMGWVLADVCRHVELSRAARYKAEECFDQRRVAAAYTQTYRNLLAGGGA